MADRLPVPSTAHRPLHTWIYGGNMFVKSFFHYENEIILPEIVFVSVDTHYSLHEAPRAPLKTLEQSWEDTQNYVLSACELLGRQKAGYPLSTTERDKVLAALGEPPGPAWPLYLFTVGEFPDERIVYIGKTNAATHRFIAGHSAITALHDPSYAQLRKRLYFATVTVYSDEGNYVPLEWLHPKRFRDSLWTDLEAQLIYHFQPELNSQLKDRDRSSRPMEIVFHNYSDSRSFDATPIAPHRTVDSSEWSELL